MFYIVYDTLYEQSYEIFLCFDSALMYIKNIEQCNSDFEGRFNVLKCNSQKVLEFFLGQ